jgi:hypothetical protein
MDQKTRTMFRIGAYISGLAALAVVVYGLAESLLTTGGALVIGQSLVAIDWPFPPYFAKPVSYFSIACVAFFYCELRLWEERISRLPRWALSALQLFGFVVAFSSAYEVLFNFMLWGALYTVDFLSKNTLDPNLVNSSFGIPWNLDFATKAFSALFVISGYSVYFLRRLNSDRLI